MNTLAYVLATFGSLATAGFGIWHLTVPKAFKWYTYIVDGANELVLAIRAVNTLFSLALVLFGAVNLVFIYGNATGFSLLVVLGASCLLWIARTILQLADPQGTVNPGLRYGMLSAFILITASFIVSFIILVSQVNI